jgi:hypothetical protein
LAANYLEQLLAEWYEYRGYFVRRNVLVGRRPNGGYECELDIVAFHPGKKHLVHVEPSMDTYSWEKREERLAKKFAAGKKHIPALFAGLEIPPQTEQIAVLVYGSEKTKSEMGGGKVVFIRTILREIFKHLAPLRLESNAVPEHLAILRSFQFVAQYRTDVLAAMQPDV